MEVAIFIFYLSLATIAICLIPFFKTAGLQKKGLIVLFYIKIMAGVFYSLFYSLPKYYPNSDTWRFYRLSIAETHWLKKEPASFIADLFKHNYAKAGNLFIGENSYWNDLKSNLIVKMMAIFNLATNNSYYTNIILFNFLYFSGLVALFKFFISIFPAKKWEITTGIFLLPSTLFWCSGIHKDGLILSAIGIAIYSISKMLSAGNSAKHLLFTFCSFLLIFSFRNYVFLAFIPAVLCWIIAHTYQKQKNFIFAIIYIFGIVFFFLTPIISASINLPAHVSIKQQEFLQLSAASEVPTQHLEPTFKGFITFLPHAIDMAIFRPHPNEFKNPSYLPAITENLLLIVLIILSLVYLKKEVKIPPAIMAMWVFGITILLICGYTIPITGAIVRYRSLVLPLLITPLLCITNFYFLKNFSITGSKNNMP